MIKQLAIGSGTYPDLIDYFAHFKTWELTKGAKKSFFESDCTQI